MEGDLVRIPISAWSNAIFRGNGFRLRLAIHTLPPLFPGGPGRGNVHSAGSDEHRCQDYRRLAAGIRSTGAGASSAATAAEVLHLPEVLGGAARLPAVLHH